MSSILLYCSSSYPHDLCEEPANLIREQTDNKVTSIDKKSWVEFRLEL